MRLPKDSVGHLGSLPKDMTRRRPDEGEGERRRWGGCRRGGGVADAVLGLPVLHWHLLVQEGDGWLQLGLSGAGQPWFWPSPWQQRLFAGGDLFLEQVRVESN